MYRAICLLILLFGIHCSNSGVTQPDMSTPLPDLGMAPGDLGAAPADLSFTGSTDQGPPGQTKICSVDGWCWENPLPQGNTLTGVWGTSASNAWAVGQAGTILKWNGSAWAAQPSGTTQDLNGIWGVDANNVWAVGAGGIILKGDYDPPIRTYTDSRMEMSCQLPARPSQVMSTFRTLHEPFGTFS